MGRPFFGAHRTCDAAAAAIEGIADPLTTIPSTRDRDSDAALRLTEDLELEMRNNISAFTSDGPLVPGSARRRLRVVTCADEATETAGSVWHAGIALARYLAATSSSITSCSSTATTTAKTTAKVAAGHDVPSASAAAVVLELGAGCGIPGLVVAACQCHHQPHRNNNNIAATAGDAIVAEVEATVTGVPPPLKVVITDVEENIAHLNDIIRLNAPVLMQMPQRLSSPSVQVEARRLYFGCDEDAAGILCDNPSGIDLILGADIGFDLNLHPLISSTLARLAPTASTRVLLCEEVRWGDIFAWYVDELGKAFDITFLDETNNNKEDKGEEIDIGVAVARAAVSSTGSPRPIRLMELRRKSSDGSMQQDENIAANTSTTSTAAAAMDYRSIKKLCMQEEEEEDEEQEDN